MAYINYLLLLGSVVYALYFLVFRVHQRETKALMALQGREPVKRLYTCLNEVYEQHIHLRTLSYFLVYLVPGIVGAGMLFYDYSWGLAFFFAMLVCFAVSIITGNRAQKKIDSANKHHFTPRLLDRTDFFLLGFADVVVVLPWVVSCIFTWAF